MSQLRDSLTARYLHDFKERLDKHVGEKFMKNHWWQKIVARHIHKIPTSGSSEPKIQD